MPESKTVYGEPFDEKRWDMAKARAKETGHDDDRSHVIQLYKSMSGTIPTRGRTAVRKPDAHMRLVLTKGGLDEFRCGKCGALLFKGFNLEKSQIEVKCRSCSTLLVSDGLLVVQ